jgi:hypothetical protein
MRLRFAAGAMLRSAAMMARLARVSQFDRATELKLAAAAVVR